MNVALTQLSPDSKDRTYFETINDEAFPLSERMSFDEIFHFASETDTDVLGIYDDGAPVGFVVLLKNEECAYVYYIAVDSRTRSKGYGGAALQKLTEEYQDLQLILDFEAIDETAENNGQRVRRKKFYLRNGFHETGYYTLLCGEPFEVVCSGGELRKEALKDLLRILHKHRSEFSEVLVGG
ncbi:MAG: GNAT family N-acetyltransferase [Christensenellaceae bacterium]